MAYVVFNSDEPHPLEAGSPKLSYCDDRSPDGLYVCTRAAGHDPGAPDRFHIGHVGTEAVAEWFDSDVKMGASAIGATPRNAVNWASARRAVESRVRVVLGPGNPPPAGAATVAPPNPPNPAPAAPAPAKRAVTVPPPSPPAEASPAAPSPYDQPVYELDLLCPDATGSDYEASRQGRLLTIQELDELDHRRILRGRAY